MVERYSGLKVRRPLVGSWELEQMMAARRFVPLSALAQQGAAEVRAAVVDW